MGDRVQPHPASREGTDWHRWLLEALGWHCCHACLRLRWRDQGSESMAWLRSGFGRLGFHPLQVFAGESAQASGATNVSEAVKQSFNNMRIIVSLGWAIY